MPQAYSKDDLQGHSKIEVLSSVYPEMGDIKDKTRRTTVEVELRFSLAKRQWGMGLVVEKLWETDA